MARREDRMPFPQNQRVVGRDQPSAAAVNGFPSKLSPSMGPLNESQFVEADRFDLNGGPGGHTFFGTQGSHVGTLGDGAWRMPSPATVSPHLQYSLPLAQTLQKSAMLPSLSAPENKDESSVMHWLGSDFYSVALEEASRISPVGSSALDAHALSSRVVGSSVDCFQIPPQSFSGESGVIGPASLHDGSHAGPAGNLRGLHDKAPRWEGSCVVNPRSDNTPHQAQSRLGQLAADSEPLLPPGKSFPQQAEANGFVRGQRGGRNGGAVAPNMVRTLGQDPRSAAGGYGAPNAQALEATPVPREVRAPAAVQSQQRKTAGSGKAQREGSHVQQQMSEEAAVGKVEKDRAGRDERARFEGGGKGGSGGCGERKGGSKKSDEESEAPTATPQGSKGDETSGEGSLERQSLSGMEVEGEDAGSSVGGSEVVSVGGGSECPSSTKDGAAEGAQERRQAAKKRKKKPRNGAIIPLDSVTPVEQSPVIACMGEGVNLPPLDKGKAKGEADRSEKAGSEKGEKQADAEKQTMAADKDSAKGKRGKHGQGRRQPHAERAKGRVRSEWAERLGQLKARLWAPVKEWFAAMAKPQNRQRRSKGRGTRAWLLKRVVTVLSVVVVLGVLSSPSSEAPAEDSLCAGVKEAVSAGCEHSLGAECSGSAKVASLACRHAEGLLDLLLWLLGRAGIRLLAYLTRALAHLLSRIAGAVLRGSAPPVRGLVTHCGLLPLQHSCALGGHGHADRLRWHLDTVHQMLELERAGAFGPDGRCVGDGCISLSVSRRVAGFRSPIGAYTLLCKQQFGEGSEFDGEMCACSKGYVVRGGVCRLAKKGEKGGKSRLDDDGVLWGPSRKGSKSEGKCKSKPGKKGSKGKMKSVRRADSF